MFESDSVRFQVSSAVFSRIIFKVNKKMLLQSFTKKIKPLAQIAHLTWEDLWCVTYKKVNWKIK